MFEYSKTIYGILDSKSNSRQIVRMGNRMAVIKSPAAREFVAQALAQLGRRVFAFEGRVALLVKVYYPNERRDLDVALLCDVLQDGSPKHPMANIIKNDRQVRELHAWHFIDKDKPRVEFVLREIGENAEEATTAEGVMP